MAALPPKEDFLRDAQYVLGRLATLAKLLRPHCPETGFTDSRAVALATLSMAEASLKTAIDKEGKV